MATRPKRIVFLGTPDMAVPELRALHAAGHDIALVVTRPDRRRGRGSQTSPSPVKAAALELGLDVSETVDDVLDTGAELGVVVAYGRLIKPHVLAAVPMINVHFSLLPRWRGAAPVERALLAGDAVTGACIMDVDETLDTGAVYACEEVPIGHHVTLDELRTQLVEVGTRLLVDVLDDELPEPRPQVGDVTYADKIDPAEWELRWTEPAELLHRWIRAGHAWTTFRGKRLRILAAALVDDDDGDGPGPAELDGGDVGTASGRLRLVTVQPEGRAAMPWRAFANGARPSAGERLGS
jgi:methionyl-tRNA formyltransferase